jgi:hypothetical protein
MPTVNGNHNRHKLTPKAGDGLATAVLRWPTPTANQYECDREVWEARREREKERHRNGNGFGLTLAMEVQRWPTPQARDGDGRAAQASRVGEPDRHGGYNLDDWVKATETAWPTPTASRWDGLQSHGRNVVTGALNPAWVEMLQGFPEGWTATAGPPRRARSSTRGSRPAPSAATPSETGDAG